MFPVSSYFLISQPRETEPTGEREWGREKERVGEREKGKERKRKKEERRGRKKERDGFIFKICSVNCSRSLSRVRQTGKSQLEDHCTRGRT